VRRDGRPTGYRVIAAIARNRPRERPFRPDERGQGAIARAGYGAMMKGADHMLAPFTAKMRAALTSVLPASMITATARPE